MLSTAADPTRTDLYAPGASIALQSVGTDLRRDLGVDFTQAEVDLSLNAGGQFRFTIPRAFDPEKREFVTRFGQGLMKVLRLGRRVWIKMGYGDFARQRPLISGFITAISTSFSEGGAPEIEVSGMDACYLLGIGTREHQLEGRTFAEAVNEVAQHHGLSARFSGTPPAVKNIDSNLQSDLQFLGKLAESFSNEGPKWLFFVRSNGAKDELVFRPRSDPEPPLATLEWGNDLIGFKPEINLGSQVKKVIVRGWDEKSKQAFIGEATAEKGNDGGPSGGDIHQAEFGIQSELILKLPVRSKEEADMRAKAALEERKNDLFKGEGETFGMPELLPDTGIRLDGLGQQFNHSYYVTKTVHRYDTSGYRTRFSVERPVA